MRKDTKWRLMGALVFSLVIIFSFPGFSFPDNSGNLLYKRAKNIIFMVPDGMGLSNVTAARIFKNGPDGDPLYLETFPQIGYQRTYAKNSTITDSAAAASAWACGEKFNNGEVSCHDENRDGICDSTPVNTILELAKGRGKATGLVVTSGITHATPAVWAAHVYYRNCETEIGRQYIEVTGVDVLLGGGIGPDVSSCKTKSPKTVTDLIAEAQILAYGYTYVDKKSDMMNAVGLGKKKVLGLFTSAEKTPETYRVDPMIDWRVEEPTLPEMTAAALDILEKDKDGFFLMVEGSQIDRANHTNDLKYQIGEILAFDEAVKVILDWVNENPLRKNNTLIIIVADHDSGGFAVNGPSTTLSIAGDLVEPGWTSKGHTGQDTIVWSQGPGSSALGQALDNTDLYFIMKDVLR